MLSVLNDNVLEMLLQRVNRYCTRDVMKSNPSQIEQIVPDVSDLIEDIHARNRNAGWWTDIRTGEPLSRNYGELLMLAVSELAEIPSSSPSSVSRLLNTPDDKLPRRRMVEVKLADFLIRIFDTAGALHWRHFPQHMESIIKTRKSLCASDYDAHMTESYLFAIVRQLAKAMEACRKLVKPGESADLPELAHPLAVAALLAFRLGEGLGLDVAWAIGQKIAFNAQRADHKPENRLKKGGKEF